MKKIRLLLATIIFLLMSMPAYALTPPYGRGFDNEHDLMISLKEYIDNFPKEGEPVYRGYGASHNRSSLVEKQVIFPKISDENFSLKWCEYREEKWDDGVNWCMFSYKWKADKTINIYLSYHKTAESVTEDSQIIKEGKFNGIPYRAYKGRNDLIFYYMTIDNILVEISDYVSIETNILDSLTFEKSNMFLPVFTDGKTITQHPLPSVPDKPPSQEQSSSASTNEPPSKEQSLSTSTDNIGEDYIPFNSQIWVLIGSGVLIVILSGYLIFKKVNKSR